MESVQTKILKQSDSPSAGYNRLVAFPSSDAVLTAPVKHGDSLISTTGRDPQRLPVLIVLLKHYHIYLPLHSAVNSPYFSASINSSASAGSATSIFAIQPPLSGSLLIVAGFSANISFASMIFPDTGVMMSEADLTDSTAPIESPALTSRSTAGSST